MRTLALLPMGILITSLHLQASAADTLQPAREFAAQLKAAIGHTTGTTPQDTQRKAMLESGLASFTLTLQEVENGEAEPQRIEERQIFVRDGLLPPDLVPGYAEALQALRSAARERATARSAALAEAIDKLVDRIAQSIDRDESRGRLELLLVEIGAMHIPNRSSQAPTDQRSAEKLAGALESLRAWLKYLDHKQAGNADQANEVLKRLSKADTFPVVTRAQLEKAFLPTRPLPGEGGPAEAFAVIKTLDDLPKGIAILETVKRGPGSSQSQLVDSALALFTGMQNARRDLHARNALGVNSALRQSLNGTPEAQAQAERLKDQLMLEYAVFEASPWFSQPAKPGEGSAEYIDRAFQRALTDRNYPAAVKLSGLDAWRGPSASVNRQRNASGLAALLAGKQFEEFGDLLMALTKYREVIALPGIESGLLAEAGEGTRRVGEKNPQLLVDPQPVLTEQLRALEKRLEGLSRDPRFPPR